MIGCDVCGEEVAKFQCKDCGTFYCKRCTEMSMFHCDCRDTENIKLIKKEKKTTNAKKKTKTNK